MYLVISFDKIYRDIKWGCGIFFFVVILDYSYEVMCKFVKILFINEKIN